MTRVVEYVYTGEMTIDEHNLDGFMLAAEVFQIKGVSMGVPIPKDKNLAIPGHVQRRQQSPNSSGSPSGSSSSSDSSDDNKEDFEDHKEANETKTFNPYRNQSKKGSTTVSSRSSGNTSQNSEVKFACCFCQNSFKAK
jgi:hypothetical protein